MAKSNYKTVVISTLDNSRKEDLPISILETKISTFGNKKGNIIKIDADAYWIAWKLKKAQICAVSMRDLEYLAEIEARSETNPKTVVLREYHDL